MKLSEHFSRISSRFIDSMRRIPRNAQLIAIDPPEEPTAYEPRFNGGLQGPEQRSREVETGAKHVSQDEAFHDLHDARYRNW